MTKFLSFLTGLTLLCQANQTTAQTGAVKNKGLDQFFSSFSRSSSPVVGDGHPKTMEVKGEDRNLLSPIDLFANDLLRASCEKIMKEEGLRITSLYNRGIYRLMDRSGKMKLQLRGIYTQASPLYFLFLFSNRPLLTYHYHLIRFFLASPHTRKNPFV